MSNDKLYNILNGYVLHCGIDWWDRSLELSDIAITDTLPKQQPESTLTVLHIS